jgi:glycosyltransferase involved in cell wall biosynthesis
MNKNDLEYSIVTSVFNDGYLARNFCKKIDKTFKNFLHSNILSNKIEVIFINDGSSDNSLKELIQLAKEYNYIKVIDLSRNFGQHAALSAGFFVCNGKIVIRTNIDMQDDPLEIPSLIKYLKKNDYDLVSGFYSYRRGPYLNKLTSQLFFLFFRAIVGLKFPENLSSMRIMNRDFIDAYNLLSEKFRFPQGTDSSLGFRQGFLKITHHNRIDRKSSYSHYKRLKMAVDGILYYSDKPLKFMAFSGFFISFCGFVFGIYLIVEKILGKNYLPGYVSLASIALLAFGIQILSMGILGLYISKIFNEVKNRPLYIIRKIYT